MTQRIKLDVFSLPWMGHDPRKSRSAGVMSIAYMAPLDRDLMFETLSTLLVKYPFFCSTISEEDGEYYFDVPSSIAKETVEKRIRYHEGSLDLLFADLSMREIDLFKDPLYQINLIDKGDHFIFVIYGSHLAGDGLTSATVLSLIMYNYYLGSINQEDRMLLPEMQFRQLLEYGRSMRHTRFRLLWVPKFLRFIPGYIYYKRFLGKEAPDQILNQPAGLEDNLYLRKYTFSSKFNALLEYFKEELGYNSNNLIHSLVSYSYMNSQGYRESICTYPINLRNKYGFEAGNLITANSFTMTYKEDFLEFMKGLIHLLNREKKKVGPYYAVSLGKFLPSDYETAKERMRNIVASSNLRFSNVGRLPAQNLDLIDHDIFEKIPLQEYRVSALPMTNIGAHFFVTSLKNQKLNAYYLTILHYDRTTPYITEVTDAIDQLVNSLHDDIFNT